MGVSCSLWTVSPSNSCRRPIVARDPQYTFHCLILAQNHPLRKNWHLDFVSILLFVPQSFDPHTAQSGLCEISLFRLEASGSQESHRMTERDGGDLRWDHRRSFSIDVSRVWWSCRLLLLFASVLSLIYILRFNPLASAEGFINP